MPARYRSAGERLAPFLPRYSALADRAPERDALARRVGALLAAPDEGSAAAARASGAAVDPGALARTIDAGEGAVAAVAVGSDGAHSEVEEGGHVDLRRRPGRQDP